MTFLTHFAGRRTASGPNRRLRGQVRKNVAAAVTFILSVGFAAALVFGFLGH